MHYKVSVLFFFFMVSSIFLHAQKSIQGKIIDSFDQQPLIGASILLSPKEIGTITNENGDFKITYEEDSNSIIIKYLGYEEKRVSLKRNIENLGEIELQRSSTTLDEIILSASPDNFKGEFKGSNFRISPLTMKNLNPLSVEEVLKTVPGVNIIGDMGLSNRPNISIRGSWGRRSQKVLLMEDGTPSAPAPYIAPGAYYNPISDRLSSIEVYKGADMLRYGPNNMYGAINYITALPPQKPELRVKLIGGQRNYQTALLSYGGTWNNLGALVEGVYKNFGGFIDNSSVNVLNLNAKVFAKLSENQSLYFKVSGQFEDNQASLSSQTPFTFDTDPTQNPFDADRFTMRRYGLDIIHKWLPHTNLSLTSKIYASDFERDWWRQITAKVRASDVKNYDGEDIFNTRYSYMMNKNFDADDYVIVGRVINGRESTSDSRWTYTVSGFKETMAYTWNAFGSKQQLEANINFHYETYKDLFLVADSSRWARSGRFTTDLRYKLFSANGFIRNEFNVGKWAFTPILRIEHVDMYRQNIIFLAQNPNAQSEDEGKEPNVYNQVLPGLSVEYKSKFGDVFGSIYEGMIAPSKVFGFLVESNGVVNIPLAGQNINIGPELGLNTEIGWRGNLFNNKVNGQLTFFNNTSRNFYAAGENEVFQELGKINIRGVEFAIAVKIFRKGHHQLRFFGNLNLMKSKVLAGILYDKDLFSKIIHSSETKKEYIEKVNDNRHGFDVYVADGSGAEILFQNEKLTESDFPKITKSLVHFGNNGISNAEAPYTPRWNTTLGFTYDYKELSVGTSGNFVSGQYTEFNNFKQESADGAIGQIPSFYTIDVFANYDFTIWRKLNMTAFVNGKNITNEIYRASRLNRAASGVFGGGFRQIIFGLNLRI